MLEIRDLESICIVSKKNTSILEIRSGAVQGKISTMEILTKVSSFVIIFYFLSSTRVNLK